MVEFRAPIQNQEIIQTISQKQIKAIRSSIDNLHQPKGKWFKMDDFILSTIPDMFTLCDFQRAQNTPHVRRILESIINNQFYDNMIRCVKIGPKSYKVIDGQHRLSALWMLHRNYNVRTYPLTVQVFSEDEAIKVFRKINSGKTLTTKDHLKTYDDGTFPFFDELRPYCTHMTQKNRVSFLSAVNSYLHYISGSTKPIKIYNIADVLEELTQDKIDYLYRMTKATAELFDKTKNPRLINASLQKILYKIGANNNFSSHEFEILLGKMATNEELIKDCLGRFSLNDKHAYELSLKIFNELKLK